MSGFSDPNGTHDPASSTVPPAAWGDLVRDDIVWLGGDSASGNGKPMCRVYNSAALSIATATATVITFNSERYDVGGCHSTSSNTGRLTVPSGGGGVYHIGGSVSFAANATGIRNVSIRLNGTTVIDGLDAHAASAAGPLTLSVNTEYKLAAADYVELLVTQTSGGLLNVSAAGNYSPEFHWSWLGVG